MKNRHLLLLVLPLALIAEEAKQSGPPFEGAVAIGISHRPDFPGSRTGSMLPAIDLQLTWRPTGLGVWQYNGFGFMWCPNQDPRGAIGIVVRGDAGRTDRKSTLFRPGSERLKGLGSIDPTPEFGLIGMAAIVGIPFHAEYRKATSSHRGQSIDVGFDVGVEFTERLGFTLSPSASWGDEKVNRAYFGISQAQSGESAFPVHNLNHGWQKVGVFMSLNCNLRSGFFVRAAVDVGYWIGQAVDSPLIERRNALTTFLVIGRSL